MIELTLSAALFIGVMGSTHCLVMCGGLGTVLGISDQQPNYQRLLSYNVGRLLTYSCIGAVAGFIGQQLQVWIPYAGVILRSIAGVLMISMGLYIARWWMGLTRLEQLGAKCWRYLQPLTRRVLPVRNRRQAMLLGMLWGLLPCGLVYSTLAWALATAQWQQSALLMFVFGLGTLPAMFAIGVINQQLLHRLKSTLYRGVAGVIVVVLGVVTLLAPWQHLSHTHAPFTSETNGHQHHSN